MFKPKVSIIIPVFNGAKFLRQAIDSALAQTYDNFEVLVINDGSNDNDASASIALSYGNKIRYFYKPNGGVASALNLGIQEMRGEYFSWLSHDDVYLPDKIAKQIKYLSAWPDKNILLFSDYQVIDEFENHLYTMRYASKFNPAKQLYAVFKHMINGCTILIAKQSLVRAGLFRNFSATQDYDMWFRLSRILAFHHLPEIVLYSRQHVKQGCWQPAARQEADIFFIRIMSEITEKEILGLEKKRSLFFAEIGRSLSNITMPNAYNFAWRQAEFKSYILHKCSLKFMARNLSRKLGILEYMQAIKRFCLGKSNLYGFGNDLLRIRREKNIY